jgi:hypothetical protein
MGSITTVVTVWTLFLLDQPGGCPRPPCPGNDPDVSIGPQVGLATIAFVVAMLLAIVIGARKKR